MAVLSKNRTILSAYLAIAGMLWALPTLADSPATPAAVETHWQKMVLQHVVPSDIFKALPYRQGTSLPAGVTHVYGLAGDNSLFVEATPGGFARLQDIVRKLDIPAPEIQIRMTLARATAADLDASGIKFDTFPAPNAPVTVMGEATGPEVARFAQTLRAQGAVLQSPLVMTNGNAEASMSVSGEQPVPLLPDVTTITLGVLPRVNSDGSLTLVLHPRATRRITGKSNPDGTPATGMLDFQTVRTIGNGQTWVITNLFSTAVKAGDGQLLLFVTPTVVSNGSGGTVTVQQGKP